MKPTHVAAIDSDRLVDLITAIRNCKRLPLPQRLEAVTEILSTVAAIKVAAVDDVVCLQHAAELRQVVRSTVYREAATGHINIYRACCRDLFSRAEILAMKPRKNSGGRNRGMPWSDKERRNHHRAHASRSSPATTDSNGHRNHNQPAE